MKYVSAKEAKKYFQISGQTLKVWKDTNKILTKQFSQKKILYDIDSVNNDNNITNTRKNVIYARVMNKHNLNKHIEALERYCRENGLHAKDVYKDVTFNVTLAQRKGFNKLLDDVISYKIGTVVTLSRKSLSGTDSEFIEILFAKFGCDIRYITEE